MLTPAVLLVALAGCSGSGGHRTVSSTSSTTASTISGTSTASSSNATPAAACTSNAIQPVLDRSVPTAAGVRIVGVEVRECRNGYARVMAIVDNSGCGKSGGSCYGNEQVFLRDVNGRWTYLDSGSGIVCQTDNDLRPETLKACQELGLR